MDDAVSGALVQKFHFMFTKIRNMQKDSASCLASILLTYRLCCYTVMKWKAWKLVGVTERPRKLEIEAVVLGTFAVKAAYPQITSAKL
jgi:hypothetical protein